MRGPAFVQLSRSESRFAWRLLSLTLLSSLEFTLWKRMVPAAPHLNSAELSFFLFFFSFFLHQCFFTLPPLPRLSRWTKRHELQVDGKFQVFSGTVYCPWVFSIVGYGIEFTVEPGEFSPPP